MANEQKNEAPETKQVQTGIDFHDLVLARNVIQVASKRGAFTDPNEFRQIGDLYAKLDTFIKSVEAAQADAKQEDTEASEAVETDTKQD